jgi:hypothetical protein
MVDGDCAEYAKLPAKHIKVADGITLHVYDNEDYVWMCYTYPDGSLGMLDMKLKTDKLTSPLNLHVSAQLGEWPADRDDLVPKSAESNQWWNISGWTANNVWANGIDTSGPQPRIRLRNARARELQLSKERFGHGDWQFSMAIHNLRDSSGKTYRVSFPADGSLYTFPTH